MKFIRQIGSLAFVLGLVTAIFAGIPWAVITSKDPVVPWWLRTAVFCILGGIILVLITVSFELRKDQSLEKLSSETEAKKDILLLNSDKIQNRDVIESQGLVQGNIIFAIWIGKDLSAILRLMIGGELTEYTEMMGKARKIATDRMLEDAEKMGADAVINVRYQTTSVIGSAAELLAYGTAVKLG
ncbi:MAG: YbjQ family protein [Atribacterota bacterium]